MRTGPTRPIGTAGRGRTRRRVALGLDRALPRYQPSSVLGLAHPLPRHQPGSIVLAAIRTRHDRHPVDQVWPGSAGPTERLAHRTDRGLLLLITEQTRLLAFGAALFGLPVRHCGLLTLAIAGWAFAPVTRAPA
jgi:hypothetical protein